MMNAPFPKSSVLQPPKNRTSHRAHPILNLQVKVGYFLMHFTEKTQITQPVGCKCDPMKVLRPMCQRVHLSQTTISVTSLQSLINKYINRNV